MEKEKYALPDSKVRPKDCLVLSYKVSKGIEYDNRHWDKANWARCLKAASILLALCGTLERATECLSEMGENYDRNSISWTLETIARNAHDWMQQKGIFNANAARARLRMAIAQSRTAGKSENPLAKISEREIYTALGVRPTVEHRSQKAVDERTGTVDE